MVVRFRLNPRFAGWKAHGWWNAILSSRHRFSRRLWASRISELRMVGTVTVWLVGNPVPMLIFARCRQLCAVRGVAAVFIILPGEWMMKRINWRSGDLSQKWGRVRHP